MNKPITTKLNSFASLIAASVVVLGLSAGVCTAHADEVSKVVKYSDLNLDTPAGASTLYHRIQVAARDVCSAFDRRDITVAARHKQCVDNAIAGSVSQVNRSSLTALHNKTAGRVS